MPRIELLDPTKSGRPAEHLENKFRQPVVGQDEAIHRIARAYQTHFAGLSPVGRAIGNFLFFGPTGSGKTRIVTATAESVLKDSRAVIKIHCAEFQHSHEIAKLIGSLRDTWATATRIHCCRKKPTPRTVQKRKLSFVLFDEIENDSDALWNLPRAILDKVTLTLGDNRRVDFSAAMVFLTSNLGATEMSSLLSPWLVNQKPYKRGAEAGRAA